MTVTGGANFRLGGLSEERIFESNLNKKKRRAMC